MLLQNCWSVLSCKHVFISFLLYIYLWVVVVYFLPPDVDNQTTWLSQTFKKFIYIYLNNSFYESYIVETVKTLIKEICITIFTMCVFIVHVKTKTRAFFCSNKSIICGFYLFHRNIFNFFVFYNHFLNWLLTIKVEKVPIVNRKCKEN